VRVFAAEPTGEGSGVATTDDDGLASRVVFVKHPKEISQVRHGLLRAQLLQTCQVPVVKWLGIAVKSVLKDEKPGSVRRANHEGEEAGLGDGATIFSTDVDKVGRGIVDPVLFVDPVALLVGAIVLVVVVVDDVGEVVLNKVSHIDDRQILSA